LLTLPQSNGTLNTFYQTVANGGQSLLG